MSQRKFREPWQIRIAAAIAAFVIRIWMATLRTRVIFADGRPHPIDPAIDRFVYAFWHEGLLALLTTRPKVRVLISQHPDGEFIAQTCQWLGIGVVRGSTARGGSQALLNMIRAAGSDTHLAITPDGPRGPRRELQPGIVLVASQTGLPVVPIGVGFVWAWRAGSWDRFAIPLPFSTLVGVVGEPMPVPPDLDRPTFNEYQVQIQARLRDLTDLAEEWAGRIACEGGRAIPPVVTLANPPAAARRAA